VRRFYLRNDGVPRIRVDRLIGDVDMLQIFRGALVVERLELQDAYVRVDRRKDGSFDLGLPEFGGEPAEQDQGPPPDLGLQAVRVEGLRIDYRDGDMQSRLLVKRLEVGEYSLRAQRQEIPISFEIDWDDQTVSSALSLTLEGQAWRATGSLQTDLLDLERAQRLARLEPQALGQFGITAELDLAPGRVQLAGRLLAPALDYNVAGREVSVRSALAEDLTLDVTLQPDLGAVLDLGSGLNAESWAWSVEGQRATGADLRWLGHVTYRDGQDVSLNDMQLTAGSVDWADDNRAVTLSRLDAEGRIAQPLGADLLIPELDLGLRLEKARYSDGPMEAEIDAVSFDRLVLGDRLEAGGRPLSLTLSSGPAQFAEGMQSVAVGALNAALKGAVSLDAQSLAGDLAVSAIQVGTDALPNGPLTVDAVEVGGLAFAEAISAASIRVKGLGLPGGLAETALAVGSIDVQQASFDAEQGVAIGEIVIDGLVTGLIRDQDGVWQHVMTAPDQAQQGPEGPGADADVGDSGLAWRLGGLRMTGDSYLTVADTLNPDMKPIRYQVERVALGGLDSNKPDRDTSFEVLLRPDQFSEFQIAGTARPLSDALYLDAEGHLHGFGLTSVNGLIANDLGHRFLDGQFDNDFHIKIEANQLDMGNQLSMAALDVEEIPDKEGPPLGTAIALLEDRDGNIKLEVPVSGDLTDPDFRVLGALNPIIMKAVAGTAALAIQPFGSVLLVGTLLADQALKVTFEPALFDPGTTTLNQAAEDYLAQLGAKLKEKPKLGVRVCGIYAAVEREKNNKGEFTDDPEALLVLAQQRADAVKAFMQGQGVGAKQLRTCRPSIDPTEEGLPRVDIRF
jgi:hypothetical protein